MKPRTVFITLEVTTDIKISELKDRFNSPDVFDCISEGVQGVDETFEFNQIQINVIKSTK